MDHSKAMKHKNLLFAALADLLRRPVRSVVAILCLAAAIFPIFTALAVSEGVRFQARISVERGADLYVSQDQYGGNGPVALASLKDLAALEGVEKATPRVVGRTYFVDRLVSVVGLDRDGLRMLKKPSVGRSTTWYSFPHRNTMVLDVPIAKRSSSSG